MSALTLDIRSFYIFGKIPFVAFAAVLLAMAGEHSHQWQSATKFVNRIKRSDAPPILKEFYKRFDPDLRWFFDHINLYRNHFIEHPLALAMSGAIVVDHQGARLVGLKGGGITAQDEALMAHIESELGQSLFGPSPAPTIASHRAIVLYSGICKNLHTLPDHLRDDAIKMIQRVGLESGELEVLAERLCDMYAGFISFFAEWKEKPGTV